MPLLGVSRDPLLEAQREARWRARTTRRWNDQGPRASERWAYRAPWRPVALSALMVGFVVGRTFRQWAEPSLGVVGETPWAVGRILITVMVAIHGWMRLRACVALYAEWAQERPQVAGPVRWLVVAVTGVAAAVLPAFLSLPARPAPPPDVAAIARAVQGATGPFELLDGHLEATSSSELSLVGDGPGRWYVATRDADGGCHGIVHEGGDDEAGDHQDGAHERIEPLGAPCTAEHARDVLG